MLLLVIILKGLAEVLLLTFFAQGILFLFAGASRDGNVIYRLFQTVNRPVWKATRFVTPRFIVDGHIGLVAFFLLAAAWVVLVFAKVHFYLEATRAGG